MEYASVVCNSITSTVDNELERIQQRFAANCFNSFFAQVRYGYSLALEELKLPASPNRSHRLNILFVIQVYISLKFCPFILEIVGLPVLREYLDKRVMECREGGENCITRSFIICGLR
jgi:hypothetical protein